MSRKTIQPPEHLLDDIEEITNIKKSLSLRDRSLTSANGLYVQSGSLPGCGTQYMAGGEFIAKLVFVRKPDGSREIGKYQSGDWESKVNEVLELCRALTYQDNWPPEKKTAYELPVLVDRDMLKRVSEMNKQHNAEIKMNWRMRGHQQLEMMRDTFFNELKNEWPVEYVEIQIIKRDAKKIVELILENIIMAYSVGYMHGKGWISFKELENADLYFGGLLAVAIGDSLKGSKSKGTAFTFPLISISARGRAHVWRESEESKNL